MKALKDNLQFAKVSRLAAVSSEKARRFAETRSANSRNALEETVDLYGIRNWGGEYFDVNPKGEIVLAFEATRGTPVSLKSIIDELRKRGISTPVVLRFPQLLDYQIKKLAYAFKGAIQEYGYQRDYIPVYPIKVNQKKEVVQEVLDFGERYNLGIEVGSKAELTVAMAMAKNPESPIICNGVKDEAYLKLALLSRQLGRKVFVVLESLFELRLLLELSKKLKIRPMIGLRLKLSARGSGKWEKSSGDLSKFGFTTTDLLKCVQTLAEEHLSDCLALLHFHIGSQVTDIKRVKYAVKEAART